MTALLDVSRRLPGITPRGDFGQRVCLVAALIRALPIELRYPEPFPGAACCQLTKLATYKAAPLQMLGLLTSLGAMVIGIYKAFRLLIRIL
jgi:hypothetical protein